MLTLQTNLKHNGANTNLYCDGQTHFVDGCPACDEMYEARMATRWEQAKTLAGDLSAAGLTDVAHHADLWKISAKGRLNGRLLRVQELTRAEKWWWM